ncbi:MAG: AAA family ATPase [bacterium]
MAHRVAPPTREIPARAWQVLLIGGTSGVGKTSIAREVARAFDVTLAQSDAFRLMLERATTSETHPALHRYLERADASPDAAELCAWWIDVAGEVSHALEIVVAFHATTGAPTVIEGDTLLPALGAQRVMAGVPTFNGVRSVILHEPDESRLAARLANRFRGHQQLTSEARQRELERNMSYGRWLVEQASIHDCPVVVPSDGAHGVAETAARIVALFSA